VTHPESGAHPRALALAALLLIFLSGISTRAVSAQSSSSAPQASEPDAPTPYRAPKPGAFTPDIDLSLGVFGQFTATRIPTSTQVYSNSLAAFSQVTQSTSLSGGGLATLHQSFAPWLGYNVNFGYTRFTEHYSNGQQILPGPPYGIPTFIRGDVRTAMQEVTIASVVEGPRTRKFSTFAQLGGGGLFFEPNNSGIQARQQTRPAMVFGVGANFKLSEHLDLRAEYRGLFYKSPDFNVPDITPGLTSATTFPMTRLFTVTSTPAFSLVYHFGHTKAANPRPGAVNTRRNER
jgi:opacity protein-like surface antigen